MGKFDGILICTDLDGTLYKKDKTISAENKAAIEYFKREGGYFTFITGRLPYYSTDAYEQVRPNVPYGCINGGGVYDGAEERYIWAQDLSRDSLELARYVGERVPGIGIQLCTFDKTYFASDNFATDRFRAITGVPHLVCSFDNFNEEIAKIIFCSAVPEEVTGAEQAVKEHHLYGQFDFIRSERTLFEILPKGVDKGLALRKLAEYLSVDMSRTVAIGDYDNDASMLRIAGAGIAVANASPAAMEAARFVTVSHEEHAIAEVIYAIERGEFIS